ncbi:MAG: large conductance mechanosensitive channel protein MscL [Proteobacteria bacterium]|jgi:large conductance mechanosensitive channel|nr:large conductance mechanosensitive channel protein MscL [Pseudomonadota bacterium]
MLKEFKEFAIKGNMLDMAIGIILGAAFGGVVKSMVDDLLNPIIGVLTGGTDFSNKFIVIKDVAEGASYTTLAAAKAAGAVAVSYGLFINTFINFIIVAFVLFLIVKAVNKLKKAEAAAPAAPSNQEVLLAEIRDLLKK